VGCSKKEEAKPAEAPKEKVVPGEMVKIPAGEFILGSDVDTLGKKKPGTYAPAHKVSLPDYWIDRYEVTNGEFLKFVTQSDYKPEGDWRSVYRIGIEDYPVAKVTVNDAEAYAKWAGKRLPTEAEWEKAARGDKALDYPWGNTWERGKANTYETGFRERVEVGKMEGDVSPYGVHDMLGNLQEWTASSYKAYPGGPNPNQPDYKRGYRIVRGVSFNLFGNDKQDPFKIWRRGGYFPKYVGDIGFRCASDTEVKPK
jgi:formylglycine-generating enzyme required for sulfatase activity